MHPMVTKIFEQYFEKNPYINKIVSADVECTSFSNSARIFEIGACGFKYDGVNVIPIEFQSLVNPHIQIPPEVISLTHITDDMVLNAPEDKDVFPKFSEFLQDTKIIAMHNAKFDTRILRHNYVRINQDFVPFERHVRCTLELSKAAKLPLSSMTLGSVSDYFGYKNENAHRALDDAMATLFVYGCLALGIRKETAWS